MSKQRRNWLSPRRMLPMMLAGIGVYLLVSCIELPTAERKTDSKQTNFRNLLGPENSARPTIGPTSAPGRGSA